METFTLTSGESAREARNRAPRWRELGGGQIGCYRLSADGRLEILARIRNRTDVDRLVERLKPRLLNELDVAANRKRRQKDAAAASPSAELQPQAELFGRAGDRLGRSLARIPALRREGAGA